jgi:hypothetical protein
MNTRIIPNNFDSAIAHAAATGNRRLLNGLELELVRIFKIAPLNHGIDEFEAKGIAQAGSELFVLWGSGDCVECDGYGSLTAQGAKNNFDVDCPACDGTGKAKSTHEDEDNLFITDIEGNSTSLVFKLEDFDQFIDCPLYAYNREQARLRRLVSSSEVADK